MCSTYLSVLSALLSTFYIFLLIWKKGEGWEEEFFAESFLSTAAVAETPEQGCKILESRCLCWDLFLTYWTRVAFFVLHQLPMKIQARGFALAKARARSQPSAAFLFLPFCSWEDQNMVLVWFPH